MHNLRSAHRGSVATIGAFDGLHLGHQAIIAQLREQADRLKLPAVAVTFEPLPREFFHRDVPRLQNFRDKVEGLFAQGVDRVLCLRFNEALSRIAPHDFVQQILVDGLSIRYLIVGDDFRFGNKRRGGFELLRREAAQQGFALSSARTVELAGERVSSSRIRTALDRGDFERAARLLGRPFAMSGRVRPGEQLGRELGVPTANVAMGRQRPPLQGVFAVRVSGAGLQGHPGVANLGYRPTVNAVSEALLEVHLLDGTAELYGERICVEPLRKLREEERFDSLDALRQQIEADIRRAREYFRGH